MRDYRTPLDDAAYEQTYEQQVAWFVQSDPLHDVIIARRQAKEVMEGSYVRRSYVMQCETQKDYEEDAEIYGISMYDYMRGRR